MTPVVLNTSLAMNTHLFQGIWWLLLSWTLLWQRIQHLHHGQCNNPGQKYWPVKRITLINSSFTQPWLQHNTNTHWRKPDGSKGSHGLTIISNSLGYSTWPTPNTNTPWRKPNGSKGSHGLTVISNSLGYSTWPTPNTNTHWRKPNGSKGSHGLTVISNCLGYSTWPTPNTQHQHPLKKTQWVKRITWINSHL